MLVPFAEGKPFTSRTRSAVLLHDRRDAVLSDWISRVQREVQTAATLTEPVVIDTIPMFLEKVIEALSEESSSRTATEASNLAEEHGGERARVTRYGPDQIIHEYQLLFEVVREHVEGDGPLPRRDEKILRRSFDRAIREAMTAYFLVHARIREQFTATLTHDLRTPIGVMKMAAELIYKGPADMPIDEINDLAKRIAVNARRADRMIRDLLDASTMQIGERLSVTLAEGDMAQIVREAVADRPERERARLTVDTRPVIGHWDHDALQRSVENLVSNAFKYGCPERDVAIKVSSTHGRVIVTVHNEGDPIPEAKRESLFQVFRRADAQRRGPKEGWGIGLALVRSTAERMGGSVGIDSSADHGTTFTLDMPCDARPFADAPTAAASTNQSALD